jgi:phage/plasmid-associated DNA primase
MEINEVDTYIASDIIDLSNYILNDLLFDKLIKCEDDLFYLTDDKIIKNRKVIEMELYKLISKHDYNIIIKDNIVNASKIHMIIKNIVESLINKCPRNDKFKNDIWNYTQFKIFFQNGYYDFKENRFIEGIFNKTFTKINKKYSSDRNKEAYDILMNKILYPVFSIDNKEDDKLQYDLLEFFLYRMSRIMAGCIEDKVWILLQGFRNSGKGVLSDLLKNCFENYIMTTNSGNFILKKSNGVDSAKSLSWIIDYQFSRLAITQEITIDENEKIDGNMIKKFCSGGDYLQARKNHQDETEFKIQSSLMICCNDLPEIKPSDTMEFCNEFQMKSKFIDDDFDESNKIDTFKYYKKDDNIKNDILKRDDILMEFINLLFEYYSNKKEYPYEDYELIFN